MSHEFTEDFAPVAVGDVVYVSDETREEHFALVTAVHGTYTPESSYIPCINVVYVATDPAKRDPYGSQLERMSSLQHHSQVKGMPHPGRFWANLTAH